MNTLKAPTVYDDFLTLTYKPSYRYYTVAELIATHIPLIYKELKYTLSYFIGLELTKEGMLHYHIVIKYHEPEAKYIDTKGGYASSRDRGITKIKLLCSRWIRNRGYIKMKQIKQTNEDIERTYEYVNKELNMIMEEAYKDNENDCKELKNVNDTMRKWAGIQLGDSNIEWFKNDCLTYKKALEHQRKIERHKQEMKDKFIVDKFMATPNVPSILDVMNIKTTVKMSNREIVSELDKKLNTER